MQNDHMQGAATAGGYMAHCHIAEHAESGMRFTFVVEEAQDV
jgi:FtsP/CotA-like multicopper oxidase with cupredoxin domain